MENVSINLVMYDRIGQMIPGHVDLEVSEFTDMKQLMKKICVGITDVQASKEMHILDMFKDFLFEQNHKAGFWKSRTIDNTYKLLKDFRKLIEKKE